MATSPLRPIRHTGTYISLKIVTALCDVAADVSKDLSFKQRQKEAEAKKGGKKVKEAENKVKEVQSRKKKLEEYMRGSVDA
jgi:cohesin complex subunit SA-1/2